ncbi:MAG: hypothetical protein KGY81_08110 [Phycisphaerae bacterium]|nr:hypothetical protein [Phycisphaerae bacterium]
MAWSEVKGSRRIEDSQPNTIDYVITFEAGTSETIPSCGNTYSDVTGSGSLSSTDLWREPVAVSVGELKYKTAATANVTVRFRGHYEY